MNRRSFLASILRAGASAAILPAAVTYARTWKRQGTIFLPFWIESKRESFHVTSAYTEAMQALGPGSICDCPIVCPTPAQLERIFNECAVRLPTSAEFAQDFDSFIHGQRIL